MSNLATALHLTGIKKRFILYLVNRVYVGTRCFEKKRKLLNSIGYKIGEGQIFKQTVGRGTWIGGGTTVCNSVDIGNSSVVAGCACVTKDVPDNVLVGGVPAKIIRSLQND